MSESQTDGGKGRRFGSMAALVVGGAVAGAVLAGVVSANAATTTPSPSTSTGSSSSSSSQPGSETKPAMPDHGSTAHESAEKPVTGDAATKAKAAALAAVGGTAGEVTTDFTGTGYEVTVTKADGTTTEVHLNSSFDVQQGGRGGHGPGDGHGPGSSSSGSSSSTASPGA